MKQENLTIRLTKSEKSTLQKLALLDGKTMTDFIKSKVFDIPKKPLLTDDLSIKTNQEYEKIINEMKKYLMPILQTTVTTYAIIDETLGKQITQERKKQIIDDMKTKVNGLIGEN